MSALVEILVPAHSASRPLERLAGSVVARTDAPVLVRVIAHNIEPDAIAKALGRYAEHPSVRVEPFADGIPSPAGPLRHALGSVRAPWFAKIDSDDFLAPHAVDSWLETARRTGAEAVIPPMVLETSRTAFPTPPQRPLRRVLDPVRDRLAYRTSTMGLLASPLAEAAMPQAGLATGEDIAPSLRLWFGARRIARSDRDAAYLVGEDAADRVTGEPRPMAEELGFVEPLLREPFWDGLGPAARISIVAKLVRVQVLGAGARRAEHPESLEAIRAALDALLAHEPRTLRVLSRLDVRLIDALRTPSHDLAAVRALFERRRSYLQAPALVPRPWWGALRRDAPVRFLAASVLAARRNRGAGLA